MAGISVKHNEIGGNGSSGIVDVNSLSTLTSTYPNSFSGSSLLTINGRVKFFGDPNSGLEPITLGDGTVFYVDSEFPLRTDILTSGTSWSRATVSGATQIKVWVVGGGGSGGSASTDSGREKVASGGGAGGVAVRTYTYSSTTSASISIGAAGAASSGASGGGTARSGRNGGTTTFNPNSGTTISATGGSRGFGSRQGTLGNNANTSGMPGENSTSTLGGQWGGCGASVGGTGSGGDQNYTGGVSIGFSIGGDGSSASGGGSVNFGLGSSTGSFDGLVISGSGQRYGEDSPLPDLPSGISAASNFNSAWTFRGGAANEHSSGTSINGDAGTNFGAGGGGMAQESGALRSGGAGTAGVIIVQYL